MATSPTVLASTSTASPTSAAPPAIAKFPLLPMLLAVVAGVVIAGLGIGVVYYLARTGRIPMERGTETKKEADVPASTHAMVLEPLLVNLADAGGTSYLRVALTLRLADVADKKSSKAKDEKNKDDKSSDDSIAAVRDTVLTVLGRQAADDLLATDGKDQLKAKLKAALAQRNSDLKLVDIFFTDFLVQR